MFKVI